MSIVILVLFIIAIMLIGIAWYMERSKVNGLLFFVTLCAFLTTITPSYWKFVFSILAAVAATYIVVLVIKRRKDRM